MIWTELCWNGVQPPPAEPKQDQLGDKGHHHQSLSHSLLGTLPCLALE